MDFNTFCKLCEQKKNQATDKETKKRFTDIKKAYDAYGKFDSNFQNLDISSLFENIRQYYEKALIPHFSPTTVSMYMKHINDSIEQDIVKEHINADLLRDTKPIIQNFIKNAHKDTNRYHRKTQTATTEKPIEIDEVEPVDDDENICYPLQELALLQIENNMLKEQLTWTRQLVMQMLSR